jgi:replicative DNA helicase
MSELALVKRERVSAPATNGTKTPSPLDALAKVDAEMALIGAVLLDPTVHASVAELAQPGDFFLLFHGYVWYAFDQIIERNEAIDPLSVADELAKLKGLDQVNIPARLTELMTACPDPLNAEQYARRVREAATLIRMHNAAAKMQEVVIDRASKRTVDEKIDECNRLLFAATDQNVTNADTRADAIIRRYFDAVMEGREGRALAGVPTGFRSMDELTMTLTRGEVTVVGGGEGMGKTSLMLSVLHNVVKDFKLTAVHFSLEMMQDEVMRRFMAMETSIPKDTLKAFTLTDIQWSRFVSATEVIAGWPLHIVDEYPSLTPIQLRRRLRKITKDEEVHLVTIDGLWLMEPSEPSGDGRPRDVFLIMRDLNEIARDFSVPIFISHQFNGEQYNRQNKRPVMKDFAESAGVRRNAQVMIGLYRDSYYGIDALADVTEAHFVKDRNGGAQGRKVDLAYDLTRDRFKDIGRGV